MSRLPLGKLTVTLVLTLMLALLTAFIGTSAVQAACKPGNFSCAAHDRHVAQANSQGAQASTNLPSYVNQLPRVPGRYYYLDNRYCGDGVLYVDHGINYCALSGQRVYPVYSDFAG